LDPHFRVQQDDLGTRYIALRIKNASDQLVYDLVAQTVRARESSAHRSVENTGPRALEYGALVGNVPPDDILTRINAGDLGMHRRFSVEIAFKDAAGLFWVRYGDGTLEQIFEHPLDRYKIDRPVSWEN
jgi:hypothetical protein